MYQFRDPAKKREHSRGGSAAEVEAGHFRFSSSLSNGSQLAALTRTISHGPVELARAIQLPRPWPGLSSSSIRSPPLPVAPFYPLANRFSSHRSIHELPLLSKFLSTAPAVRQRRDIVRNLRNCIVPLAGAVIVRARTPTALCVPRFPRQIIPDTGSRRAGN